MSYDFGEKRQQFFTFSWEGNCCDTAIRKDNVEALMQCIENDWIDEKSMTFDNKTILQDCQRRGSVNCEKKLIEMGWK